ncbi:MAG: hypothetical protein ACRDPA_03065, partial [Solirubrobacteraceae bacterium]
MPMPDDLRPSPVDVLDRALKDTDTSGRTRRQLLERAAIGAAGVAAGATLAPAGEALAGEALASGGQSAIQSFGTVAVTTEALTVTLLTELLRRVNLSSSVPAAVKAVFEGAYAAELDHWRFTKAHWKPTTTKFWIPDGFFGGSGDTVDLTAVGHALVAGETLFVNLYLIGVTSFAAAGLQKLARYSAELAGCESEHRVLAENLLGTTPPNNVGFEVYSIKHPNGIEKALETAGIGFGTQGATPGA